MQLLYFLLLIGVLIAVHELGHYAVARLCGVKVLRVSLGFGPTLLAYRGGETEYAISVVPLGGYVRLLGEAPGEDIPRRERHRAFSAKPLWQRVAIVLAGPAANLLFPAFVYFHFYAAETTALSSTIGTVFEGQPADGVLKPGDRIVEIDGEAVRYWEDVNRLVTASPGRDLHVTLLRPGDDKPITKVVTPRAHLRQDVLGVREVVGQLGMTPRSPLALIGVVEAPLPAGAAALAPGVVAAGSTGENAGGSPAARAGLRTFDVITSIQGRPVETWADLEAALSQSRGEAFLVTYLRGRAAGLPFLPLHRLEPGTAQIFPARIAQSGQGHGAVPGAPGSGLRYETGIRSGELFVHDVVPGSPAAQGGIHPGDQLLSLDGTAIRHWDLLVQRIEEHPERPLVIGWRTPDGEDKQAPITLKTSGEGGLGAGAGNGELRLDEPPGMPLSLFGAEPAQAERPVREIAVESRIGRAFRRSASTTVGVTVTMVRILSQLLTLRLPSTAIGGPIMIYHLTGVAAARGVDQFLAMLALLSVNLGLLNLLPVPVLDGGQLVFVGIEAIRRRPLGALVRERASYIGLAILAALTALAAHNDIVRYWFS